MAAVGPTVIYDVSAGGAIRLGGSLGVGEDLTNGDTYRERLYLGSRISAIAVRAQMNVTGGTPTVQVVPATANIDPPSLTVSDVTTGTASATNLSDDAEAVHTYTTKGEDVVDVVIDVTGASAAGTITHVDVYAKLI